MTKDLTLPPRVHLGMLLRQSGDAEASGEISELRYEQGGQPQMMTFSVPAPYEVSVNSLQGNEFWLQGHFEPTLEMECARCLRPVAVPLSLKLGTLMRYDPAVQTPYLEEADTGEEILVFGDPDLNLSNYLAETTLLESPLSVCTTRSAGGCARSAAMTSTGALRTQRRRAD